MLLLLLDMQAESFEGIAEAIDLMANDLVQHTSVTPTLVEAGIKEYAAISAWAQSARISNPSQGFAKIQLWTSVGALYVVQVPVPSRLRVR
jgi:hypothetical protein